MYEVQVTSSRRFEPDRCEIRVPWTPELELIEEGSLVTCSLGNAEIGLGIVFYGQFRMIEREGSVAKLVSLDALEKLKGASFTGGWKEGSSLASACDEVLSVAGLLGMPYDPDGATLPGDFTASEADAWDTLQKLLEIRGWDCWVVPGGEGVYFGPRWPYLIGGLVQERVFAFDLKSNEVYDARIERKSEPIYQSCVVYQYDGAFSGAETIVGTAGEGEPQLVIRRAGTAKQAEVIALAEDELASANSGRVKGTIVAPLNPFILHSHIIRVEEEGVSEPIPVSSIKYRLSASSGSEMEVEIEGE